jgi:hypothetical protein
MYLFFLAAVLSGLSALPKFDRLPIFVLRLTKFVISFFFDHPYKKNGDTIFLSTANVDYLQYRFVIQKLNDISRNFLFMGNCRDATWHWAGNQTIKISITDHKSAAAD